MVRAAEDQMKNLENQVGRISSSLKETQLEQIQTNRRIDQLEQSMNLQLAKILEATNALKQENKSNNKESGKEQEFSKGTKERDGDGILGSPPQYKNWEQEGSSQLPGGEYKRFEGISNPRPKIELQLFIGQDPRAWTRQCQKYLASHVSFLSATGITSTVLLLSILRLRPGFAFLMDMDTVSPPPLHFLENQNRSPPGAKSQNDSERRIGAKSQNDSEWRIIAITSFIGLVNLVVILVACCLKIKRRRKKTKYEGGKDEEGNGKKTKDEEALKGIDGRTNKYTYAQLRTATENFSSSNKVGEGGYGVVYKGILYGSEVAVKNLSLESTQGTSEFINEVNIITSIEHENVVKLLGCCVENNSRMLVYEYLENKSLDKKLFGPNAGYLTWANRFGICLGIARGLTYLHEGSMPRIIHRDIKPTNILLDAQFCPKISDFGVARFCPATETHLQTQFAGTIGYSAPETVNGFLTPRADVFSFGVIVLEIVSGRKSIDKNRSEILLSWVWTLYDGGQLLSTLDPTLKDTDEFQALRLIQIGLSCSQDFANRPTMSEVLAMLTGDAEAPTGISRPSFLPGQYITQPADLRSVFNDPATASDEIVDVTKVLAMLTGDAEAPTGVSRPSFLPGPHVTQPADLRSVFDDPARASDEIVEVTE